MLRKETGTGNEGRSRDGKVDESRAGARLDEGRETERETGTMLSSRDKRTERKRTDGVVVEVLRRGVSSLYYQNISTRDQGVSSGYLLSLSNGYS